MIKIKNITKKFLEGSLEVVKDTTKQAASIVSPGKIIEQAIGTNTSSSNRNEFSEYLKNLSKNTSEEEIARKKQELGIKDQKEIDEARNLLKTTVPMHMRPIPQTAQPRPYEITVREMEEKKAQAIEAQKKQQTIAAPSGKQARGSLFARKKKSAQQGFEGMKKDTKSG
jgi:hypothetical protein